MQQVENYSPSLCKNCWVKTLILDKEDDDRCPSKVSFVRTFGLGQNKNLIKILKNWEIS